MEGAANKGWLAVSVWWWAVEKLMKELMAMVRDEERGDGNWDAAIVGGREEGARVDGAVNMQPSSPFSLFLSSGLPSLFLSFYSLFLSIPSFVLHA